MITIGSRVRVRYIGFADENIGRTAIVIDEIPTDLEPIWEIRFEGTTERSSYDDSALEEIPLSDALCY